MGIQQKLRRRLERAGLRPSIRRGQNFLMDGNQLRFISETACLGPGDVVLEVGPGTGFLTKRLALSGCVVLAVELDRGLLPLAMEETAGMPNVFYLQGDILDGKNRINPEALARLAELAAWREKALAGEGKPPPALKSVSNLPYSAGTPFVMNMLASPLPWELGVFLLQREVAERLAAPPGGKDYGSLSIAAGLAAETTIERIVGPTAFWPRPKVESAVVKMMLKPLEERMAVPWRELRQVMNAVFGSRRKILKNAVKGLFPDVDPAEKLEEAGIRPDSRGETLAPAQFLRLAELLIRDAETGKRDGRLPRTEKIHS